MGPERTILIGDIHGCLAELQELMVACAVDWKADRVISVGDLVAKGPDSHGVLQMVRETGMRAVLGNHDAKLLTIGPQPEGDGAAAGPAPDHHTAVARTLDARDWPLLDGLPLPRTRATCALTKSSRSCSCSAGAAAASRSRIERSAGPASGTARLERARSPAVAASCASSDNHVVEATP